MTQLFDTATYDHNDKPDSHLRSVHTGESTERTPHTPVWRLDDQTIEIGRRGIEKAREALRKKPTEPTEPTEPATPHRKAA